MQLKYNDPNIAPDEIRLPQHAHHMTVRAELSKLADLGVISDDEADERYRAWLDQRSGEETINNR